MKSSKLRKSLGGFVVIAAIVTMSAAAFAAGFGSPSGWGLVDDGSKLVGDWVGESICVGNHPSCHDEKVIYHISKPTSEPGRLKLAADKIVNGKPEPMYVLDFNYDDAKQTLVGEFQNARYHGLWEYKIAGDVMEGTLSLLPEKTIVRRIKVKKTA